MTYIVPIGGGPTAIHVILAALVTMDHLLLMIDRLIVCLGLLTQRLGDSFPCLLVDYRKLIPAIVV